MHRDQLWQSSVTRVGMMRRAEPKSVVKGAIRSV